MVVAAVEIEVVLVGQSGDHVRIAAGVHAIGGVRIAALHHRVVDHAVRGGIRALHFTVYNAVDDKGIVGVFQLVMPALLLEDLPVFIDIRIKHRVEIHVHQVAEVTVVAGCHRIEGLVRIRHGIQKRIERSLGKLHERIAARKVFAAVQHRVLDDVRDAGAVGRCGTERGAEGFVFLFTGQNADARAGFVVPENQSERLDVV